MKLNKIFLSLMILCIIFAFTGCALIPTSRRNIKKYTRELLGHNDFNLSISSDKLNDNDYSWDVYDKKNDLHFHVYDEYNVSFDMLISISRDVWDDYDECLIEKYKDDIPNSVQYISIYDIPEHKYRYEYEDEKEEFDSDNQEEENEDYLKNVIEKNDKIFLITYDNLTSLEKSCQDLWTYFDKLNALHYNFNISYRLQYDYSELTSKYEYLDLEYDQLTTYGTLGKDSKYDRFPGAFSAEDIYKEGKADYTFFGINYQLPEFSSSLSQEDIENALSYVIYYRVGVINDGELTNYDNNIYTSDSQYLSFGNFYNLLKTQGKNVTGTPDNFEFINDNGDKYQFAYTNYSYDQGIYFLKNNEIIYSSEDSGSYKWKPFIEKDIIADISGIVINIEDKDYFQKIDMNYDYLPPLGTNKLETAEPYPFKNDVDKFLQENCAEEVEFVGYEHLYRSPQEIKYCFRTRGRNLEFNVYRFIKIDQKNKKSIVFESEYANKVRDLYRDDIEALFDKYEFGYAKGVLITDTKQTDQLIKDLYTANKIYRQELKYNSMDFLKEHPIGELTVWGCETENTTSDFHLICSYVIDGQKFDTKTQIDQLKNTIASDIKDKLLSNTLYTGLSDQMASIHKSKLNHIYLDDKEMLYDINKSDYCYYGLYTENYRYAYFDDNTQKYMMSVDCGLIDDKFGSVPLIIAEYMNKLDGSFEILTTDQDEEKLALKTRWEYNGHQWIMSSKYDEDLHNVKVSKDGEPLDLDFHKGVDYHVVSLSAEDFCKLFDFDYKVDEDADSIYFYTQDY